MRVFGTIFKGFINLLDWATRLILGLMGLPPETAHTTVYSLEEIKQMVSGPDVEGVMNNPEREMISAVIDFGELLVRQILIPRTEIVAVEADTSVRETIQLAVQNAHTKLPVYEDSLDQIIGIVHLQDLVFRTSEDEPDERVARDMMREALFVPETISVNKLLHQFKIRKKHIAIVLDEYGGTSGVVTLDDLVEEIIGVIDDPFGTSPPAIQNMPDGSFLLDGLTLIEDINNNFVLKLEDEDYDTIAGFVLGKLGRIAHVGDSVEEPKEKIRLRVEEMDGMRIARLKLSFIPLPAPPRLAEDTSQKVLQKPVS
jgi:CBS domain containing-hemolysin-like protein